MKHKIVRTRSWAAKGSLGVGDLLDINCNELGLVGLRLRAYETKEISVMSMRSGTRLDLYSR